MGRKTGDEAKKVGLKLSIHPAILDWLGEFEVQTGASKTRIAIAGLLALASRSADERQLLISVATQVDAGLENWGGGVNGLGVKDGYVVESHSLTRSVMLPQPLQEPRHVTRPGESGAATHPRGFEMATPEEQVEKLKRVQETVRQKVAEQARRRSKKA